MFWTEVRLSDDYEASFVRRQTLALHLVMS
jgi:hypothetical protein